MVAEVEVLSDFCTPHKVDPAATEVPIPARPDEVFLKKLRRFMSRLLIQI
jgi:hypothetical protein